MSIDLRRPLALVLGLGSAALLTACEGPSPTDVLTVLAEAPPGSCTPWPECKDGGDDGGNDGGNDGGGSADVRASLTGAASTSNPLDRLMTGVSDGSVLSMNTDQSESGDVTLAFTATHGAGLGACQVEAPRQTSQAFIDDLFALLDGTTGPGGFQMAFDKGADGSSSSDHNAATTRSHQDGTLVLVGLPGHVEGGPTATDVSTSDTEAYLYSGGHVRIWYKARKKKDRVKIFCPNAGDAVTVTVTR